MKLPFGRKLLYSVGALGAALSYFAFSTYIQFFYIDILGLKATLVGLGWSLYGVWNAINDPLAGYLSDNTKTKFGRRTPWIAAAFIPLGLFFYLLWMPPAPIARDGELPLFFYFIGVVLVFDLLWTILAMNWTALFPEIVRDEKERASVSGWRQTFSVIGLLIGVALPPILVGADWSGRGGMSIGFAVVASGAFGLSLLGAREKPATKNLTQPALLPALRTSFRNLSFRWFLIANLVKEFIFSVMTATIPFWAKYVLRIQGPASLLGAELSAELQNSLLLGSIFLMALPGIPFWTWIAKRYGGRRGWQAAQAAFGVSILGLYFANDFNQAIIGTAILGLSLAGLLIYPDLLIADVIDEDAKKMGARREGMYFGINGFIIRFAFTLQGLVTALVLGTTGYISATAQNAFPAQPEAAVLGIRSMVTLIPFVASMLTILALQRYPLHGKKLEAVRD